MGWSQRELAAWWGRSESLVSKIEQGVKRLDSVDDARRLADLTGVDVVWLLGLDGAGPGWRPAQSPAGPAAGPAVAETAEASATEWETMLRRMFMLGTAAALSTGVLAGSLFDAERPGDGRRRLAPEMVADMAIVAEKYRRAYR
jgi:transcriptional regulator with XRE-family HTH domain